MDIKRCYEILELNQHASPEAIKQTYKDIVNVWHPDRFSHNPRLKKMAESKLKEINMAYETLKAYLSCKPNHASACGEKAGPRDNEKDPSHNGRSHKRTQTKDTEAFFEGGTGMVLGLWSYLSSAFHRIVEEAKAEIGRDDLNGKNEKR